MSASVRWSWISRIEVAAVLAAGGFLHRGVEEIRGVDLGGAGLDSDEADNGQNLVVGQAQLAPPGERPGEERIKPGLRLFVAVPGLENPVQHRVARIISIISFCIWFCMVMVW